MSIQGRQDSSRDSLAKMNRLSKESKNILENIELQNTGYQSLTNTTTDPLNASQTFVGEGELNNLPDVLVYVSTDQNGTFYLEFSDDGINWDTSLEFKYRTDKINPPQILTKSLRYFRVRFENTSSSNQTYLRLYTYYGEFNKLTSPINKILPDNFGAVVVRPTDYKYEVAMGKRQGRKVQNKFGFNLDVDTAAPEIIASWGGTFDPTTDIMTTAQTFDITYNNAVDGDGTTGATQLLIYYIDDNYKEQTAIHVLGNTGSDTTAFSGFGINRVAVYANGGDGYNNDDITFTATTDATIQAQIPSEDSVSQQCIFHTQIGHNFLIDWFDVNIRKVSGGGSNIRYTVKCYSWSRVTETRYEIFRYDGSTRVDEHLPFNPSQPLVIGDREVVYFTLETNTNNTVVNARFSGIEEEIT